MMRRWELGVTMLAILLALVFLCGVGHAQTVTAGPATFVTLEKNPQVLAGGVIGLHVLPPGTNSLQTWLSQHWTIDLLLEGSSFDSLKPNIGSRLSFTAPEATLGAGVGYLWDVQKPVVYLTLNWPIK